MLEAEISDFHDQALADATQRIQGILRSIPEDNTGRKLRFLQTKMGLFLAWVSHHEGEIPKDAITVNSDDETLAKALRLKNVSGSILEAEISDFHDQTLADATQRIQGILRSIPEDNTGRKLRFQHTKMGLFLAWVSHHEGEIPKDAITVNSDDETLAKALRLKNYRAAEAKGN